MEINILAIGASAVVSMVIGSIWYGPLFGKPFIKAMGMDTWSPEKQQLEKSRMGITYSVQFVTSLVMFYVMAKFMGMTGQITVGGGLTIALWAWLGFVVPVKLADSIWGGKMILFWLGAGNMLLTLLATGIILGAWK